MTEGTIVFIFVMVLLFSCLGALLFGLYAEYRLELERIRMRELKRYDDEE